MQCLYQGIEVLERVIESGLKGEAVEVQGLIEELNHQTQLHNQTVGFFRGYHLSSQGRSQ